MRRDSVEGMGVVVCLDNGALGVCSRRCVKGLGGYTARPTLLETQE
jgi:hypothetical protein